MRSSFAFAMGFALLALACGSSGSGGSANDAGGGDDAGGGCQGGPPPARCVVGCGQSTGMQCIDGSWSCPPGVYVPCDSGIEAGPGDGGGTITGDGGIDCVTMVCNAATQYCDIRGGGVQLPDAGSNVSYSCPSLPAMPCEAGTGCACIPNTCSCTDDGGAIKNECLYP